MGADMLVWSLAWLKDKKLDWEAGKKAIDALEVDEDNTSFNYSREELHNYLEEIKGSFEVKKNYVSACGRETVVYDCGSFWMLITGGMSWGDSPTELGNAIAAFETDAEHVLEAVGFNWGECMTDWRSLLLKILGCIPKQLPKLIGLDETLDPILERMLKHENHR